MGEITDGYYSDRNWRFGDELCAGENLRASVGKEPGCRVEFQKEPSLEGRDAMLTETIYNRKWLFLPVLQVGFQMHRIYGLQTGKIPVFRISVIKEISFLSADIRKSRELFRFTVPSVGIMSCLR